jgi:hypothetical protein
VFVLAINNTQDLYRLAINNDTVISFTHRVYSLMNTGNVTTQIFFFVCAWGGGASHKRSKIHRRLSIFTNVERFSRYFTHISGTQVEH